MWKRFITSLSWVDKCSLSWGSGRGLLEVYRGWTDAASDGDLEEVYQKFCYWWSDVASAEDFEEVSDKFISDGQMQPQLGIWKRLIRSLLWVGRLSWGSGRGLLEVYLGWTCAASAGDLEEVYSKLISEGQNQLRLGIWKRFIISLLVVDRCNFSWGFGRGLL